MKLALPEADVRFLRAFVTIVDAGGFSQAQPFLKLSQSTISNQISQLEESLGFTLCERGRGGFRLTKKGEVVYHSAVQLLNMLDDFREDMSGLKKVMLGRLRLGILHGLEISHFPRLMAAFAHYKKQAPEVVLDISFGDQSDLEHRLLKNNLDLAVGLPPPADNFYAQTIGLQGQILAVAKGHPLDGEALISAKSIADYPVIYSDTFGDEERSRLPGVRNVIHISDLAGKIAILCALPAIGYVPEQLLAGHLSERLVPLSLPGSAFKTRVMLFRRRTRGNRLLRTFLETVHQDLDRGDIQKRLIF